MPTNHDHPTITKHGRWLKTSQRTDIRYYHSDLCFWRSRYQDWRCFTQDYNPRLRGMGLSGCKRAKHMIRHSARELHQRLSATGLTRVPPREI